MSSFDSVRAAFGRQTDIPSSPLFSSIGVGLPFAVLKWWPDYGFSVPVNLQRRTDLSKPMQIREDLWGSVDQLMCRIPILASAVSPVSLKRVA